MFAEFFRAVSPTHKQTFALLNGGKMTPAGIAVSPDTAMAMSAVFACVRVLMESISSLPLITYRRLAGGGRERATEHALYGLLHDAPNPEMTSMTMRETLIANQCLWGNAYARVVTDNSGQVRELWPKLSRYMRVKRSERNGALLYEYQEPGKKVESYLASDILHVPAMAMNGYLGTTPIGVARQAVGLGMALDEYAAEFFGNGAMPGIVLKHPGTLSDPAYKRLRKSWTDRHQGPGKFHEAALLEEGTSVEKIGIPPEDAQFIQSRKFQTIEVARMYRVPPHLIGELDRATFSNIEQQSLEFVVYSLAPWFVRWEQAIALRLLTPQERTQYYAEHLVDGLLRGDTTSRYNAYHVARQDGWLNADEIRQRENLNPIGGDAGTQYWTPANVTGAAPALRDAETETIVRDVVAFLRSRPSAMYAPSPNGHGAGESPHGTT